ncbi:MAG: TIGR04282 family arsenosugar biosynthesis glycosyltransferase [Candidatus Pacearchaeota archaeon]
MKENLVILYTKLPKIGKSKTRIAKESNDYFAQMVSTCNIIDTLKKVSHSKDYDFMVVVDDKEEAKFFEEKFELKTFVLNNKGDQSQRFYFLFNLFKKSYKKVLLIPSDVPSLVEDDLFLAFKLLEQKKCVLGPEYNGGVYLIGVSDTPAKLFDNVRWSTEHTLMDLIKNRNGGCLLELKGDLNTIKDLMIFNHAIQKNCPYLYAFLMESQFYKPLGATYAND